MQFDEFDLRRPICVYYSVSSHARRCQDLRSSPGIVLWKSLADKSNQQIFSIRYRDILLGVFIAITPKLYLTYDPVIEASHKHYKTSTIGTPELALEVPEYTSETDTFRSTHSSSQLHTLKRSCEYGSSRRSLQVTAAN